MSKQRYEAPAVKKGRLVVKPAILSVCHSSPNLTPKGAFPCAMTVGCYEAP